MPPLVLSSTNHVNGETTTPSPPSVAVAATTGHNDRHGERPPFTPSSSLDIKEYSWYVNTYIHTCLWMLGMSCFPIFSPTAYLHYTTRYVQLCRSSSFNCQTKDYKISVVTVTLVWIRKHCIRIRTYIVGDYCHLI